MQDIAIAIGEKIHELIILEIRRIHREVMSQQEEIKHRLEALEQSPPCREGSSTICCQSRQIRMKGANIIAIRKRLRLSQAAFARLLNVDRASLYKWEHGKVAPSPATAARIVEYRGMGRKVLRKKLQELEEKMWNS